MSLTFSHVYGNRGVTCVFSLINIRLDRALNYLYSSGDELRTVKETLQLVKTEINFSIQLQTLITRELYKVNFGYLTPSST